MQDAQKTKAELFEELNELRRKVARFESGQNGQPLTQVAAALNQAGTTAEVLQIMADLAAQTIQDPQLLEQTQRALANPQQAQKLMHAIVDAIPDWIFITNRQHKYQLVNRAYANTMQLPPDEIVGKDALQLGRPRDIVLGNPAKQIPGFWPDDDAVMDSGESKTISAERNVIDGQEQYMSSVKVPLKDDDGQVWGMLGIVRDVTEREGLLSQVQQLAAIVENHPDFIGVGSLAGDVLYVNPAGLRMMGLPVDYNLAPMNFSHFYPPAEAGRLQREGLPAALAQGTWVTESRLLKVTGEVIPVEQTISINYNSEGEPVNFGITIHDITERKQAEETIRAGQYQLSEALDISRLAYWEFDVSTMMFTFNDQFYSLYRTTAAQQGGYQMSADDYAQKFVHPESMALVGTSIEKALATRDPDFGMELEHRIIRADGTEGYITVKFRIEKDGQGQTIKIYGANQDVSERMRAEAERERLLAEVEAAYRQYVRREWQQFLGDHHQGQLHIEHQAAALPPQDAPDAPEQAIFAPIALRGQKIGSLTLQDIDPNRTWTAEERALVETVSEQLALTIENLRLFDNTQQRAVREQLTREITDKMRAAPDVETIIQTGLGELANVLGVSRAYVKLTPEQSSADEV